MRLRVQSSGSNSSGTMARFVVTDQGVVAQEQMPGNGQTYRLLLLDRLTGERVWEIGRSVWRTGSGHYRIQPGDGRDGTTIYMAAGNGAIYALDLTTGETIWSYVYPQTAGGGWQPGYVFPRTAAPRQLRNGYNPGCINQRPVLLRTI